MSTTAPLEVLCFKQQGPHRSVLFGRCGFTLLELLVVLIIGVLFVALGIPQIRSQLLVSPLDRSTIRVAALIDRMKQDARQSEDGCILLIDLAGAGLNYQCPAVADHGVSRPAHTKNSLNLPAPMRIVSVWHGHQQVAAIDPVTLWVNPRGKMDHTIINFMAGSSNAAVISEVFGIHTRVFSEIRTPAGLQY